MKRYSIAPSSARRKSTYNPVQETTNIAERENVTLELQQLEQDITSTLQDIDKNLSKSNAILNDKIFPIIRRYSNSTEDVWKNVNFWKYFFESSANAELTSYQSPVSKTINDKNILEEAISKGNRETGNTSTTTDQNPGAMEVKDTISQFRKPLLRGDVEESTPTWSNEPKGLVSSTQQLDPRPKRFGKYDVSDSLNFNPPPILSTNLSNDTKSPTRNQESVFTIRRSGDQYHKLSVSPRKIRRPRTPVGSNDEFHRRSSMIKGLRDSSPTLPEPPVLVSEIGHNSSSDYRQEEQEQEQEQEERRVSDRFEPGIQRFPRTPQFRGRLSGGKISGGNSGDSRRASLVKTPLEIRQEFEDDDSDLRPPSITQIPAGADEGLISSGEGVADVSLPELETINLNKKRKLPHDEDSPFIDETGAVTQQTGQHSVASTVYHSLLTHQNQQKDTSMGSKDNTKSNSISNLFEEVLLDLNKEHPELNTQPQGEDPNTSGQDPNSSKEMGSVLHERFNKILHK